jgi:hypothetical protein
MKRSNSAIGIALFMTLAACTGESDAPTPSATRTEPVEPSTSDPGSDDTGDAFMQSGEPAPGYLDEVHGSVTMQPSGTIEFVNTLAAPVPSNPELPEEDEALGWSFCIDTKPRVAAQGFPIASAMPCEFLVHARWDGEQLLGLLIDRRPLTAGRRALTTPLEPAVAGNSIRLEVSDSSLGSPRRFRWSMFTEELGPFGTDVFFHVDEVPEGGVSAPIEWRAE